MTDAEIMDICSLHGLDTLGARDVIAVVAEEMRARILKALAYADTDPYYWDYEKAAVESVPVPCAETPPQNGPPPPSGDAP